MVVLVAGDGIRGVTETRTDVVAGGAGGADGNGGSSRKVMLVGSGKYTDGAATMEDLAKASRKDGG